MADHQVGAVGGQARAAPRRLPPLLHGNASQVAGLGAAHAACSGAAHEAAARDPSALMAACSSMSGGWAAARAAGSSYRVCMQQPQRRAHQSPQSCRPGSSRGVPGSSRTCGRERQQGAKLPCCFVLQAASWLPGGAAGTFACRAWLPLLASAPRPSQRPTHRLSISAALGYCTASARLYGSACAAQRAGRLRRGFWQALGRACAPASGGGGACKPGPARAAARASGRRSGGRTPHLRTPACTPACIHACTPHPTHQLFRLGLHPRVHKR